MASLQDSKGERHQLSDAGMTIGRGRGNGLDLRDDRKVSRSHAELRLSDGQWSLVDLNSRNGTFVNQRPILQCPLRDGDQIQIGDATLGFVVDDDEHETEIDESGKNTGSMPELSDREREILGLVAEGLTDRAIGEHLVISASTVRSHLDRIKSKTGLRRRSELTRLALELRIVD
jgi:pSer/pThr/pTyr-binding forkhead associated (FHA) protein